MAGRPRRGRRLKITTATSARTPQSNEWFEKVPHWVESPKPGVAVLTFDHGKANEMGTEQLRELEMLPAWLEAEGVVACAEERGLAIRLWQTFA